MWLLQIPSTSRPPRFQLKSSMSCNSCNLIYVLSGCNEEYIGETGDGETEPRETEPRETEPRDRVRVYHQHIKDPKYQMLKGEEYIRVCGKDQFKIFPFLQMKGKDSFEKKLQRQFKCSLN